eukprot:Skav218433  [mRNA]  locus=scaffold420:276411:281890:- [translate_table: standard]
MANRTDPDADTVHGANPQFLVDRIVRAARLDYVAGTYGGRRRPSRFLYLTVYQTLEPLFADYRKLRYRNMQGKMSIIRMDEFIDWLMREETICDVGCSALGSKGSRRRSGRFGGAGTVPQGDTGDGVESDMKGELQGKEDDPKPKAIEAEAEAPVEKSEASREKAEPAREEKDERNERRDRREDRRREGEDRDRRDRRDGREDDRRDRRDRRDDEKTGKRKDRDDREERREKKDKKEKKDKEKDDDKKAKKTKYAGP